MNESFDKKVALQLIPYLRAHKLTIGLCAIFIFSSASISLYTPILLGKIVGTALIPKNIVLLYQLVAIYASLEIGRLLFIFTQSILLQRIGQNVMHALRNDLYGHILHMPIIFFDKNTSGKLSTRITNDTVALSELFSAGFVLLISDIIIIVGVIFSVLTLHFRLGLYSLSVFPIMIYIMFFFSDRLRSAFRYSREILSQLNSFFAEKMSGMTIVQLMEKEKTEQKEFHELSLQFRNSQFSGLFLYSLFHPSITILSAASIAILLLAIPHQISNITIGTIVTLLAYLQILYQPVRNITDRYNIFLAAMAGAERIFSLLNTKEELEVRNHSYSSPAKNQTLGLRFQNVSFRYSDGGPWVLKNLSFEIQPGKTLAIVGHTGAGKSTITSLLFRFYEPQQGTIFLGPDPLQKISKPLLRQQIGFVPQEVFLFSGTIRENLILMNQTISDDEIIHACKKTGFIKIIEKLPHGINSLLEERGLNLSMGERQILAFTRVFLQNPDLLVLDEATSSVDRASEKQIQIATKELIRNRSAIIIAHRLETVIHADKIIVLNHGEILEEGTHRELMEKGGNYSKFVQLQLSSGATGIQSTSSI